MSRYQVEIAAGKLAIETTQELVGLSELLGFASRQNPNRSFLFVSKVLGKYIPVRPAIFRKQCARLAATAGAVEGPLCVMGLAETATGLGHGIFAALKEKKPELEAFYCHSTRCRSSQMPLAFQFNESHSHAVNHLLYEPFPPFQRIFKEARSLVLVDDEITTGRTLTQLARAYLALNPHIQQIYFLSLVSWLSPEREAIIEKDLGCRLKVSALLKGRFSFDQNPLYFKQFPQPYAMPDASLPVRMDLGRRGIAETHPHHFLPKISKLALPEQPLLVLGTGECNYLPFLLAEQLEQQGQDVLFLSTGQSPMIVDGAIKSRMEVSDHHQRGLQHYLYNLPQGRHIIVVYESAEIMQQHQLPSSLSAQKVHLHA